MVQIFIKKNIVIKLMIYKKKNTLHLTIYINKGIYEISVL